jgi:hypothetical protein
MFSPLRVGSRLSVASLGFVVLAYLLASSVAQAAAEKRVALVIGNSAYQSTPPLTNPKNDASDMVAALKKRGFQVIEGFDLDKAAFDRKIRDFADALPGAIVGLFFYAGHGLQVAGQNYLVPIDAKLSTTAALDWEMVRLDLVQRTMERETKTNVVFLDACRDNPLGRNLARTMGTRSAEVGQGLAPVESGVGTLISFSTQPGNVALDGSGRNSPFTGALAKYVASSNESLSDILISVRNDVIKQTQNTQVPWEHSALTGRFYFSGIRPAAFSGVTARGLFEAKRFQELKALAEKWQLPLPDFDIEVPAASVPADLRRFIGIWVSEPDADRRSNMLIASRVSKDGKLDGYWLFGPPAPNSRLKYPARLYPFAGTVTEQVLRFQNGDAKYRFRLTNENKLDYFLTSPTESVNRTFTPFWTVVQAEAERSAAKAAPKKPAPATGSLPTKQ